MLAVSISIVAMPAPARETLTTMVGRVHDHAESAGAPTPILRFLGSPERFVSGLRLIGVVYAIAAVGLLGYALT